MLKKYFLFFILLILMIPFISADEQQYITKGVSRDSSFQQDGSGVWAGRTGATYQRSGSYYNYVSPLVNDIDNDGINEIVTMNGNSVEILNYTTGIGLRLEASYNINTVSYNWGAFYQTPALIDYDSDGFIEIIAYNVSDVMTIQYNGTDITLEQTAKTYLTDGSGSPILQYPVIKCGTNLQFKSNTYNCVIPALNRTLTQDLGLIVYDLTNNTITSEFAYPNNNGDTTPENTHLVDVDNDAYLDVLYRVYTAGNDDIFIRKFSIDENNAVTQTALAQHLLSGNAKFTDIIVNDLDANPSNGKEITWGYTSDGTNWDAYTIKSDGSVYESSYCLVTSCPEGESASFNLFVSPNQVYSDYSGDVCYYVRNSGNNDPNINTDTIHCLSLFAGKSTKETTVPNTINTTSQFESLHYSQIYGTDSLLLTQWGVNSQTQELNPLLTSNTFTIPVDYQKTGSLDIIGINSSRLTYYDDAYTNQQVLIDSYTVDTGNPVCLNEIVGVSVTLSDNENDVGYCHIQETWGNGTIISVSSNTSFTTPNTIQLNYNADTKGTFLLNIRCQDQFNLDNYRSSTYTVSISNDSTSCNIKGTLPQTVEITTDEESQSQAEFENNVDSALSDVGITSTYAKSMLWLLIMIGAAIGVFMVPQISSSGVAAVYVVGIVEIMLLVLGWILGMISAVPIVVISLVCCVILVSLFMGRGNSAT